MILNVLLALDGSRYDLCDVCVYIYILGVAKIIFC